MESKADPPPSTPSSSSSSAAEPQKGPWNRSHGLAPGVRRFSFPPHVEHLSPGPVGRSPSFRPLLDRSDSCIGVPPDACLDNGYEAGSKDREKEQPLLGGKRNAVTLSALVLTLYGAVRSGNRHLKRLALMIALNAAYSTVEMLIGIGTSRFGLVSDAFHLTFGCGLLTFSLLAMTLSQGKPDGVYTYGYKRLEVLAAFTNTLFLLFMSFSLAVEALHAFIQDESEHKHYLIFSAVTNLLVNLIGVWFFRGYARVNLVYRRAEDMNHHSVCLHVLADSIRSAGIILASWFLTLGVENAEVLCLGLVSIAVLVIVMPLFRATGSILLQKCPSSIPSSAFAKCWRQIMALEDVAEVSHARFWELVPGHVVGSLSIQLRDGADEYTVLRYVHGLYHDLRIQELTVQTSYGPIT